MLLCVLALAMSAAPGAVGAENRRPNIVMVMIDDLGWMDLHCQGNPHVRTPNIDRLATQGMRFTDAYAAAPVCSPTRAAVLTGQSPARLRITNHIPDRASFTPKGSKLLPATTQDHLPVEHVTIAERLKAAGYATGFIGKWHLCGDWSRKDNGKGDPRFHPEKQGFDVNIAGCAMGGPPTFFDPYRIHALPPRKKGEYLPDRLADESVAFMRKHRDEPFLLMLWPYTVHWPMEAPQPLIDKYADKPKGPGYRDHRYAAMIEAMDAAVGRVLKSLDDMDLAGETLVVFTSDNGGFGGVADNRPLRGDKGSLYEGGIRVPFIVRWPGKVKANTTNDTPIVSMDLYPTFLNAAGVKGDSAMPLDGEDLSPIFTRTGQLKRDAVYFHYPNFAWHRGNRLGSAIRTNQYKLIERFDDGSVELYDMKTDRGERRDLSKDKPDLASKLRKRLHAWRAETDAAMPRKRGRE